MMTKNTSPAKGLIKKLTLIPFVFGLIFFLCLKTVAQEKTRTAQAQSPKKELTKNARRDAYYAGVRIIGKNKQNNTSINKMYEELTAEEKKTYLDFVPDPIVKKEPSIKEYNDFKDSKKYAIWIDNKNVSNQTLENYSPKDFAYFIGSNVYKNARSKKFPQPFQYSLYTHNYFDKTLKNSHLKYSGKTINMTIGNENRKVSQKSIINDAKNINIKQEEPKTFATNESSKGIQTKKEDPNAIYSTVQVSDQPEYVGGMNNFYKFIAENYKTPKTPEDVKLSGRVYVTYIIEVDGTLSNIKLVKDIGYGAGDEAIRVLKLSPKWNPGKINGEAVRTTFTLPITIQSKA